MKYFAYFKLKFISNLQYRAAAWAGLSTQFFFGLLNISIFMAFFSSKSVNTEMSLEQTVTYFWLNQMLFSLIYQFYKDRELFELVRTGNISYELVRPQNLYFMWYAKIIGTRLAMVTLRCLPLLIITIILPTPFKISLPASINSFILFLISLIVGTILVTSITTLYPIIMLTTMNEKGFLNLFVTLADLLSGGVIPLPFFPKFLRTISLFLPFQYISDLPFRIYVGNISIQNGIIGIIIQFFWILVTMSIGYLLMQKSLKRVCVQGG